MKIAEIKKEIWLAGLIALFSIFVYFPALQNGFVNWDDELYVTDNPYIRLFNFFFLRRVFLEFSVANWHPLTWISHAVDYALWGLNPFGHHLTSILLHGLNTFLVVLLTIKLGEKASKKSVHDVGERSHFERASVLIPAAITGLLFGIHPIHVESVAWVSERKDVLYSVFYLLSLLSYVRYVEIERERNARIAISRIYSNYGYLWVLTLFLLSLLSKPMAVTLPFVLIILDWYPFARFQDKKNLKIIILEKIPFLLLSLISGIITVLAQRSENFYTASLLELPLSSRILVAFRVLFLYVYNFFLPFQLTVLYKYPSKVSLLSLEYLPFPLLFFGITATCIFILKDRKYLAASWLFYIVTLLPVLGIIQVGWQSMADRYMYLTLMGPSILIGLLVRRIFEALEGPLGYKRLLRTILIGCLIAAFGILVYTSIRQISFWKDGVALWTREIEMEPTFPQAYQRRGNAFRKRGFYAEAINDYTVAISLDPSSVPDYYNDRGVCYVGLGLFHKAIGDFDKAVSMRPDSPIYRNNLERALMDIERLREKGKPGGRP